MTGDRGLSGPHLARLLGEWRSGGPAYAALARAVRLLVLDGRLPLRTRLPGERELAEALGVSRTTATAAYAALREEGYLASRRGAGSWTRLPADPGVAPAPSPGGTGGGVIDLSCAASAAPDGDLHAALAKATAELPRHLPGPGYDAAGLPVLREAIAAYLSRLGAPTTADQIFVSAGALHGLTLLLRVLSGPGDRVVVEHPTYAAALDAVRACGARPVPGADAGRRLGPRDARVDVPPGESGVGVPDRRPPEPDRPVDAGWGSRAARRSGARDADPAGRGRGDRRPAPRR